VLVRALVRADPQSLKGARVGELLQDAAPFSVQGGQEGRIHPGFVLQIDQWLADDEGKLYLGGETIRLLRMDTFAKESHCTVLPPPKPLEGGICPGDIRTTGHQFFQLTELPRNQVSGFGHSIHVLRPANPRCPTLWAFSGGRDVCSPAATPG